MPTASYDNATGATLGTQRSLLTIYNSLNALTTNQKNAIWANFTAGNPPLWATNAGPNAGVVMALSSAAIDQGLAGAALTAARLKMVAAYLLDRPRYLQNPAFDPTINISVYVPPG